MKESSMVPDGDGTETLCRVGSTRIEWTGDPTAEIRSGVERRVLGFTE